MNDELWGIGRAYLTLVLSLVLSFVLAIMKVITGTEWLTFAGVVVSAVVGFKEGAKAYISKQNTKQQNGVTNGNSQ